MQIIKLLLVIWGLSFLGCGGSSSNDSNSETPEIETVEEPKTFDVNSSSTGTFLGKVEIPTKSDDTIKTVELVDSGSEKFKISS